jgi:putative endonuclease
MTEMTEYYCYIVECSDGTFYTGWTTDPERRTRQHNQGKGARYTRQRCPVRLVYVEPQPDRATAMRRERALKNLPRIKKNRLVSVNGLYNGGDNTDQDQEQR